VATAKWEPGEHGNVVHLFDEKGKPVSRIHLGLTSGPAWAAWMVTPEGNVEANFSAFHSISIRPALDHFRLQILDVVQQTLRAHTDLGDRYIQLLGEIEKKR
jgi:hypothetical protein